MKHPLCSVSLHIRKHYKHRRDNENRSSDPEHSGHDPSVQFTHFRCWGWIYLPIPLSKGGCPSVVAQRQGLRPEQKDDTGEESKSPNNQQHIQVFDSFCEGYPSPLGQNRENKWFSDDRP